MRTKGVEFRREKKLSMLNLLVIIFQLFENIFLKWDHLNFFSQSNPRNIRLKKL